MSLFSSGEGVTESHAIVHYTDKHHPAGQQFANIKEALLRLKNELTVGGQLVFMRYFLSDAVNQAEYIHEEPDAAVSIVQQPPLNGTKVAVWAYFVGNCTISKESSSLMVKRSGYEHIFTTRLHYPAKDEKKETKVLFENYLRSLSDYQCNLKDNCIRTWIYVQGVDLHYKKMVEARTEVFKREGLTEQTHYIASTGIEGRYIYPDSLVLMDAYAIKGIKKEQITYLRALRHLSPTYKYGVTFERGTAVDYGDRRHIFISGTASIDKDGEIVYPDDIIKQTERTFGNIVALLDEADASMKDVAQMIVYLRDTGDYQVVSDYISMYYPEIPYVIVWAPVCRPGWLVEVECIAVKEIENHSFHNF